MVSPIPASKRIRRPTVKVLENADARDNSLDSEEKMEDSDNTVNSQKVQKESESDSFSLPMEVDFDRKDEMSNSMTSSPTHATPKRGRRPSVQNAGASPKHKDRVDLKNAIYKKPFEYGWRREVVIRGTLDQGKRQADIYYFPPNETGNKRKIRSMKEIESYRK